MPALTVLDAAVPADRERWLALWEAWADREILGHPAYAALFAEPDQRVLLLSYEDAGGAVLYPVIARPLDEGACDLTSPYSYGGPFVAIGTPRADGFWEAFDAWARDIGAATLFGRLSLFDDQRLAWPDGCAQQLHVNVVQDLRTDPEALWSAYKHKVRKNVKRARREGLVCTTEDSGEHLDAFLAIYLSTMDRNAATQGYYFPRAFFETLLSEIPGGVRFFHVWDGDAIVSTELVLLSRHRMYSFLGGTLADAFAKRPNDLLKDTASTWGIGAGMHSFVLGGGYGKIDGIFRYKLAFAPTGEVPYAIGRRDLQPALTQRLVQARTDRDPDWAPRPDFFPPYRS